jgi:hypothetical protein
MAAPLRLVFFCPLRLRLVLFLPAPPSAGPFARSAFGWSFLLAPPSAGPFCSLRLRLVLFARSAFGCARGPVRLLRLHSVPQGRLYGVRKVSLLTSFHGPEGPFFHQGRGSPPPPRKARVGGTPCTAAHGRVFFCFLHLKTCSTP